MEYWGLGAALAIGVSLGMIGGGGSILTVPAMVYLMGINPVLSTAYSLFVVGTASMTGALGYFRKGLVNFKTALVFAVPSVIAVYLTRLYLVPAIPQHLFDIGTIGVTRDLGIMVFFAFVMLLAAISMIRAGAKPDEHEEAPQQFNYPLIIVDGLLVGTVTGIVGAGGGFLIVPALVLLAKLPMKEAVGTSLLIIAVKSLFGFMGDVQSGALIDWEFLLSFTCFAVFGILLGSFLASRVSAKWLKSSFGWFVLVMSMFILCKELC